MRALVVVAIVCLLVPLAAADNRTRFEGPFAIEVTPTEVSFHIDGAPGVYSANVPVKVAVNSGFRDWTVFCQATPMAEVMSGSILPASRICLVGGFEDTFAKDNTLVALDQPLVVGRGTFTGPSFVNSSLLNLKFKSEWQDKPGTYIGQITFTFLASP